MFFSRCTGYIAPGCDPSLVCACLSVCVLYICVRVPQWVLLTYKHTTRLYFHAAMRDEVSFFGHSQHMVNIHSAELLTGNTWGWCRRVISVDWRRSLLISSVILSMEGPGRHIGTTMPSSPLAFLEAKRKLISQGMDRTQTASTAPPYTGLPHQKSK